MDSDSESTVSTMEESKKTAYLGHAVGGYNVKSQNLDDPRLTSMDKKQDLDAMSANGSYTENYYAPHHGQGQPLLHARHPSGVNEGAHPPPPHHPPPHGYYGHRPPPPPPHTTSLSTNNLIVLLLSAVALAGVVHFGTHGVAPGSMMMPNQAQQHHAVVHNKKVDNVLLSSEEVEGITDEEMNDYILQQKAKNKGLRANSQNEDEMDEETEEEESYVDENGNPIDVSEGGSSEMKSNGFLTGKKTMKKMKKKNKKGFYDLNDDMAMPQQNQNQMGNNFGNNNMKGNNMGNNMMMNNQQQQALVPLYDQNGNPMLDQNGNVMMMMQPMQQMGMNNQGNNMMQGQNNNMMMNNNIQGNTNMMQNQNMMMQNQNNNMMMGNNNQGNSMMQSQNNMMMNNNNQGNNMMPDQSNTMQMNQQMPPQQQQQDPNMQQQPVVTSEQGSTPAVVDGSTEESERLQKFPLTELNNFKDNWDPWERSDVPIFFHIPKAGGSTVKDVIGTCHRFVMATEMGITDGHANETEIAVVYPGGGPVGQDRSPFVNVDTTTLEGIARAKEMGFADSGLADAVVTPFIYEANDLFTPTAKGRLFTVFRHPIDRAISMFYYIQVADWEPTYDPELKDWTIAQYAQSSKIENNWLTRQLSNKLEGDLADEHLDLAMEVIRRKFMVGLMTQIEETMERFERFYRWTYHVNPPNQEKCRESLLKGGSNKNSSKKDKPQPGSEEWELLVWQNQYDMQLYDYIEILFKEQEQFVADIPVGFRNQDATCCKCGPPTFPPEGFTCPLAILN